MKKISLDKRSIYLRKLILRGLIGGNRGHIGSSMSLVEILRVLYDKILKFKPKDPLFKNRDRLIFSKGHGCLALYSILADKKFFSLSKLDSFCKSDSLLGGHPDFEIPGVEASSGALGHGASIGVGVALSLKLKKNKSKVFVIIGDGELGEGSNWEAFMYADKYKLNNLFFVIDKNNLQTYGNPSIVSGLTSLKNKFLSFGLNVSEVDGHNLGKIEKTMQKHLHIKNNKSHVIICNTIKGRGIDFTENSLDWHHKSSLSEDEISKMKLALGNSS